MKWTCIVTRFNYWILGKNMDLSGSPLDCARRIPLVVACFWVLSVWWETSTSVNVLFQTVQPRGSRWFYNLMTVIFIE